MKKTVIASALLCMLLLATVFLASCSSDFAAPSAFRLDTDTLTLKWNKVKGANSYEIRVSGDEEIKNTKANYYSLEYLKEGTYTIEVRAISQNLEEDPSDWVEYSFTREHESGLKYKLINNRTEYQVIGAGTANGDVVMETMYRGKPVTSIAAEAFKKNKKITSLVVGEKVTSIGKNAFILSTIENVTLPESLTSIGEYAFQSCKQLKSINVPAGVTEIAPYTFSWCSAMETCTVGGATSIGEYAFSNCEALKSLTIGKGLETIGEHAFSDCIALTKLDLPEGIRSIDSYAFFNCGAIGELTLGKTLESIGEATFANCVSVAELALPEELRSIGTGAFRGCTALAAVTMGDKVEAVGSAAFSETALANTNEKYFYVGGWLINCTDETLVNLTKLKEGTYGIADSAFYGSPKLETVSLSGIRYVGGSAFAACPKLWEVAFDGSLLYIGEHAFRANTQLQSVHLKEGIKTIDSYAFYDCINLYSMEMPSTLTTVGTYVFRNTSAYTSLREGGVVYMDDWAVDLKPQIYRGMEIKEGTRGVANHCFYNALIQGSIGIPDSVEIIGRSAFYGCMFTSEIKLPKELKSIGDYAFYGCSACWFSDGERLDGTTRIPNKTETIGRSAFYNCTMMIGLEIPASVKSIGPYAFYGCSNLGESTLVNVEDPEAPSPIGEVIFAEGLEFIGERAFQGCSGIAELVLPNSLTEMGKCAFYKCENLKSLTIGSGLKNIPSHAFYKCTELEELVISDGVVTVGKYAFRGCAALTSLMLSKDLVEIGDYAFYESRSLTELELPRGLVSIGSYAFRSCEKLTTLIIPATVETVGKHAFYGANSVTFYCEAETIPAYWNERWNSSYRPVLFGCTLSEDKSYVTSITFTENSYDNMDAAGAKLSPTREGYVFAGWMETADGSEIVYTAESVLNAPVGIVLYPKWEVNVAAE